MDTQTPPRIRDLIPRAGFVWPAHQTHFLGTRRRDIRVITALANASGVLQATQVEAALAAMFTTATQQQEQGGLQAADTVPFFLAGVRRLVPFADGLEDGVFIDLFTSLRDSRREWLAHPRPPFDIATHGPLAHAIDEFNSAASGHWSDAEIELFELAGGFSDAESQGDAMDVDDHPAASHHEVAQPQETRSQEHITRLLNQIIANNEAEAKVGDMAEEFEEMELDDFDETSG